MRSRRSVKPSGALTAGGIGRTGSLRTSTRGASTRSSSARGTSARGEPERGEPVGCASAAGSPSPAPVLRRRRGGRAGRSGRSGRSTSLRASVRGATGAVAGASGASRYGLSSPAFSGLCGGRERPRRVGRVGSFIRKLRVERGRRAGAGRSRASWQYVPRAGKAEPMITARKARIAENWADWDGCQSCRRTCRNGDARVLPVPLMGNRRWKPSKGSTTSSRYPVTGDPADFESPAPRPARHAWCCMFMLCDRSASREPEPPASLRHCPARRTQSASPYNTEYYDGLRSAQPAAPGLPSSHYLLSP